MNNAPTAAISRDYRIAEEHALQRLRSRYPAQASESRVTEQARMLAKHAPAALSAESFLLHHGLSTPEGVALMCVAEALLRIPDAETADALLRDKLAGGRWVPAKEEVFLSSAADWALLLTGTLGRWHDAEEEPAALLKRLAARLGEPVVRMAVRQAMRILAEQFVLAENIEQAVKRGAARAPYRFSYDMLG